MYSNFFGTSKCLFCDNKSIKGEGLCDLCKFYRFIKPKKILFRKKNTFIKIQAIPNNKNKNI